MITSGVLKFSAAGRVLVNLSFPAAYFNGGTPITVQGFIAGSVDNPDQYLSGFGYKNEGKLCARAVVGTRIGPGGFAMDSVGSLALNTSDPIKNYVAGIPLCADGRMAVQLVGPPP